MIRDSEDILEKLKHYIETHEELGMGLAVSVVKEAVDEINRLRQSLEMARSWIEHTKSKDDF